MSALELGQRAGGRGAGLALALLSAATFGTSGTFASALIGAGWTSAAAVTARITLAALVLTPFAIAQLRGQWHLLVRSAGLVGAFGLVPVAACQLFYFNAVSHLSVGVALLLEYLGTVLVVGWMWARHGRRPRRLTVAGAGAAILGLVFVINLTGSQRLDPVGVLWGLGAAVGLAMYFVLSARTDSQLPPLVFAWSGMCVGAAALLIMGAVHALPMRAPRVQVTLFHHHVSWLAPVLGLALVAAAFAYIAGISAARLLGPTLSSFVGLTEVLFAVGFSWLALGQVPTAMQALGGGFIVAGVILVRVDELRRSQDGEKVASREAPVDAAPLTL